MIIIYRNMYRRKSRIFVNFRFSCRNFHDHFEGQNFKTKNLLRVHRKKSNVENFPKFESKRAIHNEDLISRL